MKLAKYFEAAKQLPSVTRVGEFDIPKPEDVKTVSDLILVALGDLAALEQAQWFRFNLGVWVEPSTRASGEVCEVCVAGAVVLRHMAEEEYRETLEDESSIGIFSSSNYLTILNWVGKGAYSRAFEYFRRIKPDVASYDFGYEYYGEVNAANWREKLLKAVEIFRAAEAASMPKQPVYTPEEQTEVNKLIRSAADGDPGEGNE